MAQVGRNGTPITYSGLYLLTLNAAVGVSNVAGVDVQIHGTANATVINASGPDANIIQVAGDVGLLGSVLTGPLVINAGSGANTLAVAESNNNSTGDTVLVTASLIVGTGPSSFTPGALPFLIDYTGQYQTVGLTTGSGVDLVNVLGTSADVAQTIVATGDGNDLIGVTDPVGSPGGVPLGGPLTLDGGVEPQHCWPSTTPTPRPARA